VALGLVIGLAGCAATPPPAPTLYRRLGGREGIRGVVDAFVVNLGADARVKGRFASLQPAQMEALKTKLSDQLCEATGGPCAYLGRDMKTTHRGMNITEGEWAATVEALDRALAGRGVLAKERGELLGLLGPMKADIVGQ
jgi:hemoglobin